MKPQVRREFEGGPKVHLMVTGVAMPRMSGCVAAVQLSHERPEMKVLYMSGHTEDAIIQHGVLKEGMAFLQKPFSQQTPVDRIRLLLDNK